MRSTIALLLAIVVVLLGVFVLIKSAGDEVQVAIGVGLILAGIEGVVP